LELVALETRLDKLSNKSAWAFIAFGNKKWWLILSDDFVMLCCPEHGSSL
jgi:hypothetical protein